MFKMIENLNEIALNIPRKKSVMNLDINTAEGWNEMVIRQNIKRLLSKGIAPTKHNLVKLEEEDLRAIEEVRDSFDEVPVIYNFDGLDFNSKEELLEWKARSAIGY